MFCLECGKKLELNWQFCTNCGTAVNVLPVSSEHNLKKIVERKDQNLLNQKSHTYENLDQSNTSSLSKELNSKNNFVLVSVIILIIIFIGFISLNQNDNFNNESGSLSTSSPSLPDTNEYISQQTPAIANTSCASYLEPRWSHDGINTLHCVQDTWMIAPDLVNDILARLNDSGDVKWVEDRSQLIGPFSKYQKYIEAAYLSDSCGVFVLTDKNSADPLFDNWGQSMDSWTIIDSKTGKFIRIQTQSNNNSHLRPCILAAGKTFNINFTQ